MRLDFNNAAGTSRQRQKKYHKKVRTGCDVCRMRRVKCDENRPQCQNCIRTLKKCEGDGYGYEIEALMPRENQYQAIINTVNRVPALVVGGKVDPFNSFSIGPSPVIHQKIFDYAIHCQWHMFAVTQRQADVAVVKREVMAPIFNRPVAYYAFLYSGACHAMFWGGQPIPHAEFLRYKHQALQAMRHAVQSEGSNLPDEALFCMVLLATHGAANHLQRRPLGKVQGRKSLTILLDGEFWGALEMEWQHLDVFYDMMKRRGDRFAMSGPLWNAVMLFDVYNSWMHLRRPQLPPLLPMDKCPHLRTWVSDPICLERIRQSDQEFVKVTAHTSVTVLQHILHGLVLVMADMDHWKRARIPHFESVVISRSMCIREVLQLPETMGSSELERCTFQMARISCLMTFQAWLMPDSGANRTWIRNLPRRLVHMLHPILDRSLSIMLHERLPEFYLWTVIMGLILAYEDFDNSANGETMRIMVNYLDTLSVKPTPAAWTPVRSVVSKFLWSEEDCAETGREAWELACQIYTDKTTTTPSACGDLCLQKATAMVTGIARGI